MTVHLPLSLASAASTSILALAGGDLVLSIGGGKYKCFGLAETFIASLAVADAFPLRI